MCGDCAVLVIAAGDASEFDFVMLLSTRKNFLLLSLWLRLFAKFVQFCVNFCFILVLFIH